MGRKFESRRGPSRCILFFSPAGRKKTRPAGPAVEATPFLPWENLSRRLNAFFLKTNFSPYCRVRFSDETVGRKKNLVAFVESTKDLKYQNWLLNNSKQVCLITNVTVQHSSTSFGLIDVFIESIKYFLKSPIFFFKIPIYKFLLLFVPTQHLNFPILLLL